MNILLQILIAIIALLHLYFLYFEMFQWTTKGPKIFRSFPKEIFPPTKAMAANQGLYNGFLAAGLIWTYFIDDPLWNFRVSLFFISCVIFAGVYGAFTASKKIFFVQALPAILALGVLLLLQVT